MSANNVEPQEIFINGLDLEQLVDGVEDVTDPSIMDKLLDYAEKIQSDDSEFIELLAEKCQDKEIYWKQPWYQQFGICGKETKPVAENESDKYRTDALSQAENELILKNWRKFRKRYKLPDQMISLARWRNDGYRHPTKSPTEKARRFALAFLSRGLQRSLAQVFQYVAAHFGGYRKGYFSATEKKIIDICFYHKPKMMNRILPLLLGREKRGVTKRLSQLAYGKPEPKRQKWTLPMASKLVQHMLQHTELELEDLKNRQFTTEIWLKLEEDMDLSHTSLQIFWYCYLHVQLFARCDVKLRKLRKKIFKIIRAKVADSTYKIWSDIRWKDILLDFPDGFTHRFLYRISNIFVKTLKGYLRMPLEKVVEYALQKIKMQKGKKRNKRLRTLRLNDNGQLEVVDYRSQ